LETAALQARRAEEAERRRAEAKAAGVPIRGAATMERSDSNDRRPALPLVGAKLGWREKEKLRSEGKEVPGPARNESPMARASPMGRAAPVERTDSSERPAGPPRLALAGGKPSWRDREAAKQAGGESMGRVPSSGGVPLSRGRSGREDDGRDGSPAPAAPSGDTLRPSGATGKFVPPHLRNKT